MFLMHSLFVNTLGTITVLSLTLVKYTMIISVEVNLTTVYNSLLYVYVNGLNFQVGNYEFPICPWSHLAG